MHRPPKSRHSLLSALQCVPFFVLVPAVLGLLYITSVLYRQAGRPSACPNLHALHPGVKTVDLKRCKLAHLPLVATEFASVRHLDLSENALSELPANLCQSLPNLEILFLSENLFERVPDVAACGKLRILSLKRNKIARFDEDVLPAASLQWLMLTENRLTALPASFGRLTRLRKLMLTGNQLSALPAEMRACTSLELVRLAANRFASVPALVFDLPRLSWVSLSGNVFGPLRAASHPDVRVVKWRELSLGAVLGQGTSGVVYAARLDGRAVAVKVFKNALTNDGLAVDEVDTALAGQGHPDLVSPVALAVQPPESVAGSGGGSPALVFAQMDAAAFHRLGEPPTLDTCTRDVYLPAAGGFSLHRALQILRDVAGQVVHLHSRGVLHGDLYAHNILCSHTLCRLGDFGAASRMHAAWAPRAMLVEVRAFGALIDDILQNLQVSLAQTGSGSAGGGSHDHHDLARLGALRKLRDDTFNEQPSSRPFMPAVLQRLNAI